MYPATKGVSKALVLSILIIILPAPGVAATNFLRRFTDRNGIQHRQRNISSCEVEAVVRSINNSIYGNIQFLFGEEYEDSVSNFKPLFDDYIGLEAKLNDGEASTLDQLFQSATRNTILVLLESPVAVIDTFKMMRDRFLNGHLVKWLLILEGDEAEASLEVLEELATEGTQVLIFLKHAELFRVFQSRLDDRGVTSIGKKYPDGRVELQSGVDFSVLKALSSSFNFTYQAVLSPDNAWGNVQPNGSVTGIIGLVAKRVVTFGISILVHTESRGKVADFTLPYVFSRMALLTRAPKEKTKVFAVFTSFDVKVWICLMGILSMISPVIYVISYLRSKYQTDENDVEGGIQWFAFNMFRSLVVQGNFIDTKAGPTRLLLATWFLFCLVFSASYSGMLTAVIAVPAYETPVDSLEDLPRAVKEGFTLGVLKDSSSEYIFSSAADGLFKQTWSLFNHKERGKSFVSIPDEGMRKVLEEKFVFITAESYGDVYAWKYGRENFHFGREKFLPVLPAIPCQKGSPFVDSFTQAVLRMREGGLIDKWVEDYFMNIPKEDSIINRDGKSFFFSLVHLQAAFYLALLGFYVASLVLLAEIILAATDHEKDQSFMNQYQ